ncbi:hypothetical protein FW764_21635 [Pseudomonas sp. 1152_12]
MQKHLLLCRFFCTRKAAFMAAVRGRPSGLPALLHSPVRQPAYSCHPFVWRRVSSSLTLWNEG